MKRDAQELIYLDNAATSWPKPPAVLRAASRFLADAGGNPSRSGHRLSIAAGRVVYETRELVAGLFGAPDPLRVLFALNATAALNLAFHGVLRPGDRVVTTSIEHHAVMRPLRAAERHGVRLTVVPCAPDTTLDPADLEGALREPARMVVLSHASNVTGALLPVAEAAALAHSAGALLLVDAAQSAGSVPIDVQAMGIDILAFSGHKGLLGPPGTGGLVLGERLDAAAMQPLLRGGTGSRSEEEEQPVDLPDRFESGTLNGAGIAGLAAGIRFLQRKGLGSIRQHEMELTEMLLAGLRGMPPVRVYGPAEAAQRTAVVAFTVEGRRVSEVAFRLDEEFGVLCRAGLHCAPSAHRTLGTFPEGAIRFAPGLFTTREHIEGALAALAGILERDE